MNKTNEELAVELIQSITSNIEKGFRVNDIVKHNAKLHTITIEVIDYIIKSYENKFTIDLAERKGLVDNKTQELIVKVIDCDIKEKSKD